MLRRSFLISAVSLSILSISRAADTPSVAAESAKTIRLLKIGNSFSKNASEYLPQLVASQGQKLVLGHAEIGGCTLEKHWMLAQKSETDTADPAGKPYTYTGKDGKKVRASLKEMLTAEAWDIVTVQQQSLNAMDAATYQPFANQLAAYVRQHAPQAKIYVHETWSYRTDNPLIQKQNVTPEAMYVKLNENYKRLAQDIQASAILPTGTAFQNARNDARWKSDEENSLGEIKDLKPPELPTQAHALCLGYRWDTKAKPAKLVYDGKHATTAGKYLGALVWYEVLYGPITRTAYVPKGLSAADAEILREVAAKTVRK